MNVRRRLAVVTSRFPSGPLESFLYDEIEELSGPCDVTIFPALPQKRLKAISAKIFWEASAEFFRHPVKGMRLLRRVVTGPRDMAARLKNAMIFPKALSVAREARNRNIEHIHAYWLSAPSTIAYVVSEWNGIPWSATGHRYDLVNYNMSAIGKPHGGFLPKAQFIRTISERGRRQVQAAGGNANVHAIHLGVRMQAREDERACAGRPLRLICAAGFDPVKGHDVLFHALRLLKEMEMPVVCTLAGTGPGRARLERLAVSLRIDHIAQFVGLVPRAELVRQLNGGAYDVAILTSVDEGWQRCEGIPFCLVEAMAAGLPCIATDSGSISELVNDSNGVLCDTGDTHGIAQAILRLARDAETYARLSAGARSTVAAAFDVIQTAASFRNLLFPRSFPILPVLSRIRPNGMVLSHYSSQSLSTYRPSHNRSGIVPEVT